MGLARPVAWTASFLLDENGETLTRRPAKNNCLYSSFSCVDVLACLDAG